jgi:quercetin 2,3-dioxygenase
MKFLERKSQARWHKEDRWKKSAYAFVPYQTHFGELCGFADDVVYAGQGFGMHPHKDMEISTVMLSGAQVHKDTTGSERTIGANGVQTMSAGMGILHSEYNASQTEPFQSFQIWIYPREKGTTPRHEHFAYEPVQKRNQILLALSPDRRRGSTLIGQDAFFSLSSLEAKAVVSYQINLTGNGVYLHCAKGEVEVERHHLQPGDALGVYEAEAFQVRALQDAELIFVEVPMIRGIQL